MKTTRLLIACLVAILIANSGAFAGKKHKNPQPLEPLPFAPAEVGTIAVVSVADIRKDKSVNLKKLNQIGQRTVKQALKKSTYDLVFTEDFGSVPEVTEDDLEYLDGSWVQQLGPKQQRYVLLLVLEDAARKKTLGAAFGTVCSGYLFDKETGETMWQAENVGTAGQGGLMGMMMNSAMRSGAFQNCASKLMVGFPQIKKGKQRKS